MSKTEKRAAQNTDREIWRAVPGDFYSPSIHVTKDGLIGINVHGHVIATTVEEWHIWGSCSIYTEHVDGPKWKKKSMP